MNPLLALCPKASLTASQTQPVEIARDQGCDPRFTYTGSSAYNNNSSLNRVLVKYRYQQFQ
jgi:hypothetical protein